MAFKTPPMIESIDRNQAFFTILPPQEIPVPGKKRPKRSFGESGKNVASIGKSRRSLKPPKAWLKYYNQSSSLEVSMLTLNFHKGWKAIKNHLYRDLARIFQKAHVT